MTSAPTVDSHGEPAVVAERLTKRFGEVIAVNDVTVSVGANEIFGFIGPDGAGKTTLFRMLVTLLVPDAGNARVLGLDVVSQLWELRRHLGYMPGRFSLYPDALWASITPICLCSSTSELTDITSNSMRWLRTAERFWSLRSSASPASFRSPKRR